MCCRRLMTWSFRRHSSLFSTTHNTNMLSDSQKIGAFLLFLAGLFSFVGVMMFFDRGLLSIANFLVIGGIMTLLGPDRTATFLFQSHRLMGTGCFLFGIFMVLMGWSLTGFFVETWGFINLFGNFFPAVISFVRTIIGFQTAK